MASGPWSPAPCWPRGTWRHPATGKGQEAPSLLNAGLGGVGKLRGLSLTFQGVSLASMSLTPALVRVGELGVGLSQPYLKQG